MGCHFLLQGIFPTQGSNLRLLHCRQFFTTEPPRSPIQLVMNSNPVVLESKVKWKRCVYMLSHFSHAQLFVTLWTTTLQTSLSMGFSRQEEYWSGLPFPPPNERGVRLNLSGLSNKARTSRYIHNVVNSVGFPGGANGKEPTCPCRRFKRCGFDSRVGKIPWRRAWQPTPVFLPGESNGQRSLEGYSLWGHKKSDMTEVTWHACMRLIS